MRSSAPTFAPKSRSLRAAAHRTPAGTWIRTAAGRRPAIRRPAPIRSPVVSWDDAQWLRGLVEHPGRSNLSTAERSRMEYAAPPPKRWNPPNGASRPPPAATPTSPTAVCSETTPGSTPSPVTTATATRRRWRANAATPTGSTTCRATCSSGPKTAGTTVSPAPRTLAAPAPEAIVGHEYSAAGLGTLRPRRYGSPTVIGGLPTTAATPLGSEWQGSCREQQRTHTITGYGTLAAAVRRLSTITLGACAHQAPTVAHIHVGHAITGAHDTPGKVGYFTVAEQHARNALAAADLAVSSSNNLEQVKQGVATVNDITNVEGTYPLTTASCAKPRITSSSPPSPKTRARTCRTATRSFARPSKACCFAVS